MRRRLAMLRPAAGRPLAASELGVRLGHAPLRVECWASVEDSVVVVGPPRSGKGLHVVVPSILDAPGAVVTTSTRPDNLAATIIHRSVRGPVAIFDPQGLAAGVDAALRWSPIRGCESPQTAMSRARALCGEPSRGVDNATFWSQQAYTVVRCLLHAAALDRREPVDLVRWSLSPLTAEDAVDILRSHPGAAPAWSTALEAIVGADPRQRDSTWAMVSNAFAALADPRVLASVSPRPFESFDPASFLRQSGTLYLLGTASGAAATASLVTAFLDDIVETARQLAARSAQARLEPPLSIVLDEAANFPLPALTSLMSEGGGSGISTTVVLQSLAQARARWGSNEAAAIWDAAIVKIVLGGSANADDLRSLSALLGTRQEKSVSRSWSGSGGRSTSISTREVPVYDTSALRTLPFGRAVLLYRSIPPIDLSLRPWPRRRDGRLLQSQRAAVEAALRTPPTTLA